MSGVASELDQELDERVFRAVVPYEPGLPRDPHLADCELARAGGPYATVACASCGRARWMHATRHDTCPQHCWVEVATLRDDQIAVVRFVQGISRELAVACSRALNDFGLAPGPRRDARRAVCAMVNAMMNRHAERTRTT